MSSRSLDAAGRNRLIRLLGMLGSDHQGEVAVAGRKADQLLRNLGLHWDDVICLPAAGQDAEPRWLVMVRESIAADIARNAVEQEFLHSMLGWAGQPTEKQLAWIARIYRRVA